MSANLDLLGRDLLKEARAILPMGAEGHIIGFELAGSTSRVAIGEWSESFAARRLESSPAGPQHAAALAAAEALATTLLNEKFDEAALTIIGYAMARSESKLRVHARPATGDVAAMLLHQGKLTDLGSATIAIDASTH